jgi:hypothetical protein
MNPDLDLPNQRISVVVREDSSGQTSIITDALGYNVPSWPEEAVGKLTGWPLGELARPSTLISNDPFRNYLRCRRECEYVECYEYYST